MKEAICIIVIIAILGCIMLFHPQSSYQLAQADSEITKIEIVDISNFDIIYRYNEFSRIQSIITIEKDDWAAFLADFRKVSRKHTTGNPPFVNGMDNPLLDGASIRITYQDGSFELIGYKGSLYYINQREKTKSWHALNAKFFGELVAQYKTAEDNSVY